jgi:hypothetical protein
MNIQLALVRACLGDGCRVRLLETEAHIDVRIDRRFGERPRLRFGYLAAVELTEAPAILWHWQRAQVLIWRTSSVLAVLPEGRLVECHPGRSMPEGCSAAPEVWVTRVDGRWESHDTVARGRPAHPEALIEWLVEQPIGQQVC